MLPPNIIGSDVGDKSIKKLNGANNMLCVDMYN